MCSVGQHPKNQNNLKCSFKMIGNFGEVLNFNRLFRKLKLVLLQLAFGAPRSLVIYMFESLSPIMAFLDV